VNETGDVGECDNCGCRKPLALLKYDCGHGRAGYCWACLVGAALSIRESGGSLPAAADAEHPFPAGVSYAGPPDPPVLNKGGGSHVHRPFQGPPTRDGRELCEECGEWFKREDA